MRHGFRSRRRKAWQKDILRESVDSRQKINKVVFNFIGFYFLPLRFSAAICAKRTCLAEPRRSAPCRFSFAPLCPCFFVCGGLSMSTLVCGRCDRWLGGGRFQIFSTKSNTISSKSGGAVSSTEITSRAHEPTSGSPSRKSPPPRPLPSAVRRGRG